MLKTISENAAISAQVLTQGQVDTMVPTVRYIDLLQGTTKQPEEQKTGEEIAASVIKNAGLKVVI